MIAVSKKGKAITIQIFIGDSIFGSAEPSSELNCISAKYVIGCAFYPVRHLPSRSKSCVWLNDMSGADAVPADILANDEGTTVFQFRSGGTDNDLRSFFIKTGGGNSQNSGPLYIDDLYLENTDDLKLDNPTACKGDFDEDREVTATADAMQIAKDLRQAMAMVVLMKHPSTAPARLQAPETATGAFCKHNLGVFRPLTRPDP